MLLNSVELEPLEHELKSFGTKASSVIEADLKVIVSTQDELDDVLTPIQYSAYLQHLALACSFMTSRHSSSMNPYIAQCLCNPKTSGG